jgi:Holliday junction resolvase
LGRSFKTHLAGQIGEALVVAELGRRGIVATSFSGNLPVADLLIFRDGATMAIQVKALRSGQLSFDARKFLEINFEDDVQTVKGRKSDVATNLIYVCVMIADINRADRFFVLTGSDLQALIERNHKRFLEKHGGVRPRNPASTHTAVWLDDLICHENQWSIIDEALSSLACRD